ncbi:MAG: hypothetical protein K0R69_1791 [Clostridia bacterium]|jgi:hypothetical protein|nr:hypothetical protein [Clostridia bacterium]
MMEFCKYKYNTNSYNDIRINTKKILYKGDAKILASMTWKIVNERRCLILVREGVYMIHIA